MNFIELLQFSIGIAQKVPDADDTNWEEMYVTAKKLALTGVMYYGIRNFLKN